MGGMGGNKYFKATPSAYAGAVFVAKAPPSAPAANLTNSLPAYRTVLVGLEQQPCQTEHIQCYHDRGTGRPAAYVIYHDMEYHNVCATCNNPGHDWAIVK